MLIGLFLSFTMCSCLLLGVSDEVSPHLLSCSSDEHFHQYRWSSSYIFIFCRMKCVIRLKTKLIKKWKNIYDSSFIRKSYKGSKSLVRMFALWYRLLFQFCLDIFFNEHVFRTVQKQPKPEWALQNSYFIPSIYLICTSEK